MHPQLEEIATEFRAARERLHRLAGSVPLDRWRERADPERWSIAECVAHLNLTSAAYLPLLASALEEASSLGTPPPRRFRRDPVGWLLWSTMGPPVRVRTKTIAPFVPESDADPRELVREFERLQDEQEACTARADGLPLHRVRVASPFNARVRYNLYSCLSILPRHQHRHLWQAEQVAEQPSRSPGPRLR